MEEEAFSNCIQQDKVLYDKSPKDFHKKSNDKWIDLAHFLYNPVLNQNIHSHNSLFNRKRYYGKECFALGILSRLYTISNTLIRS